MGRIHFGASRHVASSVLSYMKVRPHMRSAINIRFDEKILAICKKKFRVSFYDRRVEPQDKKVTDGMSISWGIETALQTNPNAEVIYHLGDMGKEAMILVFDTNPSRLIGKVYNILIEYLE